MSYDIELYMAIDTGGSEPHRITLADVGNYTSNVSRMWTKALGHPLADLAETLAGEAVEGLVRAVASMEEAPDIYRAMEPANGWGDFDGALAYLLRLLRACTGHPKATIHISR